MKLKSLFNKVFILRFLRYSFGGFLSYGLKFLLTIFFVESLNLYYLIGYTITLIIVNTFNFYFNIYFIFRRNLKKRITLWKYFISILVFFILDLLIVKFLTEIINLHYIISISISTIILFITKYFIYDKLVFK